MSRAAVLLACGVVLVTASALGRRSVRRAKEVPPTARLLGQRGSVEDWRAGNDRAATAMTWAGMVMLVVGIVVGLVAAFR
jgi:hypothetical protein